MRLKAAKALNLTIPESVLAGADMVIRSRAGGEKRSINMALGHPASAATSKRLPPQAI